MSRPMAPTASVPFTPRLPKSRPESRASRNERDMDHLVGTLASARRLPKERILEDLEDDNHQDSSFHAPSASFHNRPLASRILSSSRPSPPSGLPRDRQSSRRLSAQQKKAAVGSGTEDSDDIDLSGLSDSEDEDGDGEPVEVKRELLKGVPVEVQEAWVCEDLGYVLQGIEGELIKFHPAYDQTDEISRLRGARWVVDTALDPSLHHVLDRLLPMATFYTAIDSFVELRHETRWGMVNHALVSGIRGVLRDYHILTSRLEQLYLTSPSYTLQTAFLHLHPTLHVLSLLYSLCQALDVEDKSGSDSDEDEEEGMPEFFRGEGERGGKEVKGGEVLGVIVERGGCMHGDPTATRLYGNLLLHASQPYALMLLQWISTGNLEDPYEEFMVRTSRGINKKRLEWDTTDDYWDRRYTLRDGSTFPGSSQSILTNPSGSQPPFRRGTTRLPGGACVPSFLEPWKFKVLLAGKYLNVIKECGVGVEVWEREREAEEGRKSVMSISGGMRTPVGESGWEEGGMIKMNDTKFYRKIDDAYIYANRKLLKLMFERGLMNQLRSMKHFFFLDQSEFLDQFLDNASGELKKTSSMASQTRLQSLLYMAVSNPASASHLDPNKESLKVALKGEGLFEYLLRVTMPTTSLGLGGGVPKRDDQIKVKKDILAIDAITFDFSVAFPLNLVISRNTMNRYQLIFRFLLSLRHMEFTLTNMWLEHKAPAWRRRSENPAIEIWKRRIFSLRSQMLQWVQHMLKYATGDVLETQWKKLEDKMGKVQTVDQMLRDHVDYLDACLKECTLTVEKSLNVTQKMIHTITTFAAFQPTLNRALGKYNADPVGQSEPDVEAARSSTMQKFSDHFRHHVVTHFDVVQYFASADNPALLALAARLQPLRNANANADEK